MILTPEQAEKRVSSPDNMLNKLKELQEKQIKITIKDGLNHTGRPGSHNFTEEEKIAIGVTANYVDPQTTADIFDISHHTASHLRNAKYTDSHGRGTQKTVIDQNLKSKIQDRMSATRLTIEERAAEKLLNAMGLIGDDKLENCSAKELSQIASQMSQVVRNISTIESQGAEKGNSGTAKVNIVLHAPRTSREEHFEFIEIGLSRPD